MTEQAKKDPAIIILTEAIQFEKKKLKYREWPEAVVAAIESKIKSYKETVDQRQKTLAVSTEEKAVDKSGEEVINSAVDKTV